MDPATTISFPELRRALELILDEAERTLGASVDLDADAYWLVSSETSFDMAAQPETAMEVGSLVVDDVESVRDLLTRPADEGVAVWHDLDHLCGVLRRIAVLTLPR